MKGSAMKTILKLLATVCLALAAFLFMASIVYGVEMDSPYMFGAGAAALAVGLALWSVPEQMRQDTDAERK